MSNKFLLILRGLFPEDNYEDYQVGSLILKHLKRDYSQEANSLLDWLEAGIFDALDHQHLRAVIFGIFLDPKEPNKLVECYTFKVTYPNGEPLLRIENNNGELLTTAGGGHDVMATMREGITVDNRYIVVKLHYYEHVTPADYEPPFFRASNLAEEGFIFNSRPEKIPVDDSTTDKMLVESNDTIKDNEKSWNAEDDSDSEDGPKVTNIDIPPLKRDQYNERSDRREMSVVSNVPTLTSRSMSRDRREMSIVSNVPGLTSSSMSRDRREMSIVSNVPALTSSSMFKDRREMPIVSNVPALTSSSMSKDRREMSMVSNVPALTSSSMSRDRRETSIVSNVPTLPPRVTRSMTKDINPTKVYDKNESMTHSNRVSMSRNSESRNGSITQPIDHSHSNNVDRNRCSTSIASRSSQLRTYSTQRHSHSSPRQDVSNETNYVPINSQNSPVIIDDDDESSSNESMDNTLNYKCDCGVNTRDGDMINCVKCNTWGHVPCYGYKSLDDSRMSKYHTCYRCLRDENNNLWELDALIDLALFRRSLWIIWKEGIPSTCRQFAQRLGVKLSCARQLQTRLKTEGFIAPPPKPSKRKGKTVVGSSTSNSNNPFEVIKTEENIRKMNDYFNPDIGLMPISPENFDVEDDFHEENHDNLQKTTSEFITKVNSPPVLSQEFTPMEISFENSAPASQVTIMESDQTNITNIQSSSSLLENRISHNESEKSDDGHRKHKLHDKNSVDVDADEDDQGLKKRKVSISIGHIAVL
ncbi:16069_t:CDS:10 [Dentiscutata erythropus]|uniref:16069_t:CDS:1 n=1 Tax=Dentiscutata erythropus TaxID=1348616 RepID=A0A9N9FUC3_9GLOM|nr:16069_t:CDS:10 [Dentiscutata erythropus]